MDEICNAILLKLCNSTGLGNYVIFEESEFFDCFPEKAEKTRNVLDLALKKLKSGGYIEVRYSRGDLFCLAPLKKAKATQERPNKQTELISKKSLAVLLACVFLCSLLGGFLGGLIAGIL